MNIFKNLTSISYIDDGKVRNKNYWTKEIFRLATLEGLIKDAEIWFEFAKKRNKTSHTYNGEVATEILTSLPHFYKC